MTTPDDTTPDDTTPDGHTNSYEQDEVVTGPEEAVEQAPDDPGEDRITTERPGRR